MSSMRRSSLSLPSGYEAGKFGRLGTGLNLPLITTEKLALRNLSRPGHCFKRAKRYLETTPLA